MKNKLDFIVLFSLFMAAIGGGFLVGTNFQKNIDLEHCKQAGWDFVEQVIIDRKFAENHPRGKIYGMRLLLSLHANIATKCIDMIK